MSTITTGTAESVQVTMHRAMLSDLSNLMGPDYPQVETLVTALVNFAMPRLISAAKVGGYEYKATRLEVQASILRAVTEILPS